MARGGDLPSPPSWGRAGEGALGAPTLCDHAGGGRAPPFPPHKGGGFSAPLPGTISEGVAP